MQFLLEKQLKGQRAHCLTLSSLRMLAATRSFHSHPWFLVYTMKLLNMICIGNSTEIDHLVTGNVWPVVDFYP